MSANLREFHTGMIDALHIERVKIFELLKENNLIYKEGSVYICRISM